MCSRVSSMWRFLAVVAFLCALSRPAAAVACLEYDTVSLSGRIVRQTYPGPPDFESTTKGDEPQVIWVLLLDRWVCVVDPDPRLPREYDEHEVQLVLAPDQYRQYQHLLGKKVIATGKLLPGGARYDKRLVLTASDIKSARVERN